MIRWVLKLALLAVLVVMAVLVDAGAPMPTQAVEGDALRRALLATVRVAVPIEQEEDAYSTGSGTILSQDGVILTNFHVVGDIDRRTLYNQDGLAFIAVNPTNLKGLPTWLYTAEVIQANPTLDLALLRLTGYLDSSSPLPEKLAVVSMDLADSDSVNIGDELSVIGFPGIGGDTVTFTQGKVSGFLDEDRDNVFEWIKTDAEVNHGNSGGLAINQEGLMIGVPTAGVSDVEAAGKISLVRPINLARTLIGLGALPTNTSSCGQLEQHQDGATISNLVFAQSVNRDGSPSGVAANFPSGMTAVYAVFDYDRFRNGRELRFTWYQGGRQVFEDAFDWEGGPRGSEWVNIYSDPALPDGVYGLELRYDGVLLACDSFAVGVDAQPVDPRIGPFTFATGQVDDRPVGAGSQFPAGTDEVYAFFDYESMADGLSWRQIWYVDGEVGLDSTKTWNAGEEGNFWISVNASGGLPEGGYLLELYVEGELAQSGEFALSGGSSAATRGVVIIGTVVDANRTSLAIAEALVVFLYPGTDLADWAQSQDEASVYAVGVSDEAGQFQLSDTIMPGETYPIVVLADGYRPVAEPGFTIPVDASSPYELEITLVRE